MRTLLPCLLLVACTPVPEPAAPASGGFDPGTTPVPRPSDDATTDTAALPTEPTGTAPSTTADTGQPPPDVVPLYDASSAVEPASWFDRGDAWVTRWGDRARDRHAREDEFQAYDHYLPLYFEHRTVRLQIVDHVAKGGSTLEVSYVTEWPLSVPEFRAWYLGLGTVATYSGNYAASVVEEGPGTFGVDHEWVSAAGTQHRYTLTIDTAFGLDGVPVPLAVGQTMEIEVSQFLEAVPAGRANYYGTVFLYEVGTGGLLPWEPRGDIAVPGSEREDSYAMDTRRWSGGRTTLHEATSGEAAAHFQQMATNLTGEHAQPFVRGRRVHHTAMDDGTHDESAENGIYDELVGLAGPRFVHTSCDGCHHRNGRAPAAEAGEPLDRWVVRVGLADGSPDPDLGAVLQPAGPAGGDEPNPTLARWEALPDGLRAPVYAFDGVTPEAFSARLAPPLVGMGLLEAIDEADVLALEDPLDADGDGISGRAHRVVDPADGQVRLGRFGWKAGTVSLRHQIAAALRNDMGVTTSLLPEPDCGAAQTDCGDAGVELSDAALHDLELYVALLGVRPRRDIDDAEVLEGESRFAAWGCASCHLPTLTTSPNHPLPELRAQAIQPFTDLLLHDMGPDLADVLAEGGASGAEWRTPPLWGLGLGPCVTGGVTGPAQATTCTPDASYLHDGRARTLDEAVRWHGGEGGAARDAYLAASPSDQQALLAFLASL